MERRIHDLLWMACFAALTAVGGFIRIPVFTVPVTLQSFFVILAGGCLGGKRGAGSQILFLTVGLMGIPIFAMGGGPAYVLQPTFGYLAAFPAAAWVAGWIMEHSREPRLHAKQMGAAALGIAVILFSGVIVLTINLNWIAHIRFPLGRAVWTGAVLFLPVEIIKAVVAVECIRRIRPHFIQSEPDG